MTIPGKNKIQESRETCESCESWHLEPNERCENFAKPLLKFAKLGEERQAVTRWRDFSRKDSPTVGHQQDETASHVSPFPQGGQNSQATNSESHDPFAGLTVVLELGASWQSIERYALRELPDGLFELLREQYRGRERRPVEWVNPLPAKCFDCGNVNGCPREQRTRSGLMCRHGCPYFVQKEGKAS